MRGSTAISSILHSLLFFISSSPTSATPHQAPLGPAPAGIPFTLRNATLEDVDEITTVWYDAFRPSPLWPYIHQFEDEVGPLYAWTCERDSFLQLLGDEKRQFKAMVITVPDPTSRGLTTTTTREKVVSIAMWDFNQTRGQQKDKSSYMSPMLLPMGVHDSSRSSSINAGATGPPPTFNCSAHLDVNMTRALHFRGHMEAAKQKYLDEPFDTQLYLGLLATHPDWDGNGFGATHLRWGKAQLARLGGGGGDRGGGLMPLTLLATPAGYPLYASEGFEGLYNVTLERLDGKGAFWHEVMKYEEASAGVDEL
ncbi:hypothetical protein VM1G_05356 [Cytospora mali]|uniref:N-acetyltransferase domain-containing protein n=1 Tax=Cytospora mali TaxID=578113 RepID=A0A194VYD1_CYTMA|nr:hypothetical protein VM1G_05356 [Valsa mali]